MATYEDKKEVAEKLYAKSERNEKFVAPEIIKIIGLDITDRCYNLKKAEQWERLADLVKPSEDDEWVRKHGGICELERRLAMYQDPEEPDSWEKIENDATKRDCDYWGCQSVPSCERCPAKKDGKKPMERYGCGDCGKAMMKDVIARAKALASYEEREIR